MRYRAMGSLDWEVSALGFGCMRLPTRRLSRLAVDTAEAVRIIRHGIDLGINYVDTAWYYHAGASEKVLGQALGDGYRDRVRLTTKLPVFLCRKAEDFDRYLHEQLARLRTDHLDFYLLHALNATDFEKSKRLGFIEKLERAKRAGLIRHAGFSFHDALPVFKEIVDYHDWDIAQIQYNYMDTGLQATTEGLEYAASKGIAVAIMEPLKGGRLANPPAEALGIMRASGSDRTPVDWALQFLWDRPEVSVVLSGMGSRRMVDENCASAERSGAGSLTAAERETVGRLAESFLGRLAVPCTACSYCMPCPSGVNIPRCFSLLNDLAMEPTAFERFRAKRAYRGLAARPGRLNDSRTNGNASLCTGCRECVAKCPQGIDIPEELGTVTRTF